MTTEYPTIAIIVAAGRGIRFAQRDASHPATSRRPKQYSWLDGRPLLCHCLDIFLASAAVDAVVVVINQADKKFYDEVVALSNHDKKILPFAIGGNDRQESVYRGLQAIAKHNPAKVLIHDSARPFFSIALLDNILRGLSPKKMSEGLSGAVIPCLPLTGALKEAVDDKIIASHPRQNRFIAQTPQGFDYQKILLAHQRQAGRALDDDAAVWQATYPDVPATMVLGDNANIKITTRGDMQLIKNVIEDNMQKNITITTLGVDLHRFTDHEVQGAKIMLGGVAIPAKKNIVAHSDGDVVLHALTDAILGALGAGDIGVHFPPQDEQWRGVASTIFVEKAMAMLREKNASLIHVDVTILLEEPRVNPHRAAIVDSLAALLHLPASSIGLKVTTTEKMGAIGDGQGLMAMVQTTVCFDKNTND
ncbi:MAG: 2-C-methyl-D-erythritol 2,4-cyclodiphosphate synthase [Hydrotalea sp.]|nr:2-C-methyl-D-erythritol 2,4-cyclodiphosphate synthase [Hydrotalea sp.]